jgi:amino acid transporter
MSSTKKLTQLPATAICGNEITSSCLYVSALTIVYAGQYAWLALLIVAGVLFLFAKIYGEVVGAQPLNGGTYNVLLNTSSKSSAATAGCLTILSCMVTAVISASEAMHYLHGLLSWINVFVATIEYRSLQL